MTNMNQANQTVGEVAAPDEGATFHDTLILILREQRAIHELLINRIPLVDETGFDLSPAR